MTRITKADVQAAGGLCGRGMRRFCREHGLDLVRFIRYGVDVSEIEHLDDANVTRVIEAAKERERKEGA